MLMRRTSAIFFRIFRPYPCPGMRYEVGKTWFGHWSYELIFKLTESGDDSFNRSYVRISGIFSEFSLHTFFRKKKKKKEGRNFNTFLKYDMNRKIKKNSSVLLSSTVEQVTFRWTPFCSTPDIVYFPKFKSRFLHLKSHSWTRVWTENA